MVLHDCHDQGVARKEFVLSAQHGCGLDQRLRDGKHLDGQQRNPRDGFQIDVQLGDFLVTPSQLDGNPPWRPTEHLDGFEGHQAMGEIGQQVRRSETLNSPLLDPLEQSGAGRPVLQFVAEMVNERVGIDEDRPLSCADPSRLLQLTTALRHGIEGCLDPLSDTDYLVV